MSTSTSYAVAFGFNVYLIPVNIDGVDLSTVHGLGVGAGSGSPFIDLGTAKANLLAGNTEIEPGTTPDSILQGTGVSATELVYDGTGTAKVIQLTGLKNAALNTSTKSESVKTYDSAAQGFDQNQATGKGWDIALDGFSRYSDAGYRVCRLLERYAVDGNLKCKIARVGPNGSNETVFGFATLSNYTEKVEAGTIVTWSVKAEGFGPYGLSLSTI